MPATVTHGPGGARWHRPAWRARLGAGLGPGFWPVTLAALAVRVIVVLSSPNFRAETDAADFNRLALDLVGTGNFGPSIVTFHGGPTALRPPVFSVVLSLVYRVFGVHPQAGRMLEALLGAIAVGLLWLIVSRIWNRTVATVAAGLAAVYPPLVMVGSSLLSEGVFIPVMLATVLLGLHAGERAADPARGRAAMLLAALCGVGLGLTALSRSNGVVIGLPLLWLVWRGRPRRGWAAARVPLVLGLACALTLVPWALRNERVFGTPVPTTTETGYALAGIYSAEEFAHPSWHGFWVLPVDAILAIDHAHPNWNEAQIAGQLTHEAERYLEHHPTRVLYEAWWNLRRLLDLSGYQFEYVQDVLEGYPTSLVWPSIVTFWVVGLLGVGGAGALIAERRNRRRDPRGGDGSAARTASAERGRLGGRAPSGFWWIPGILFGTLLPIIGNSRYRSPVDPFLLVLAAIALVRGSQWWRARRGAGAQPLASPRR